MPEVLYTSAHEASGRYGLLVQLVCEKHLNRHREDSAREIAQAAARQLWGIETGHKSVALWDKPLPMSLHEAHYTAQCGCRAWHI